MQNYTAVYNTGQEYNCWQLCSIDLIVFSKLQGSFMIAMFLLNVTVKAKTGTSDFPSHQFCCLFFVCSLFSHLGRSTHLFAVLCGPCKLFFCLFQEFKHPSHIINFSCRQRCYRFDKALVSISFPSSIQISTHSAKFMSVNRTLIRDFRSSESRGLRNTAFGAC